MVLVIKSVLPTMLKHTKKALGLEKPPMLSPRNKRNAKKIPAPPHKSYPA